MTTRSFILFPGPTAWRLSATDQPKSAPIEVAIQSGASIDDIAVAVAEALKAAGYGGESVLLAIPSAWCLCAPVATIGLPARNRRQAMTYRLEEKLPVAAEDVIADFIPFGPSDHDTLGVCAQTTIIGPLVAALELNGVAVAAICPAALLALQWMGENGTLQEECALWPSDQGDALELFIIRGRRLRAWYVLPDDPKDLLLHLAMEFRTGGSDGGINKIAATGMRREIKTALSNCTGMQPLDIELPDPTVAAISMAGSILAGKVTPWIDLRHDNLAAPNPFRQVRMHLAFAVAAVVICMLCLCGGMLWRANRYDQMASRHADEQQAVFREAFPKDALPVDVHSRLAAEERSLHGLSGDASAPALQETRLVTLRDLLMHLPAGNDLRYRVLELRLDQNRFTLEGQAAAHGDADSIVASLRHGGTFSVEPPRTEQLGDATTTGDGGDKSETGSKGVAFTITGAVVSKSSPMRRTVK